ncbi:MAG TPA: M6 family metalloprotease domain-containing protein [Symbiobacteriaceae bacterium]|nr:M6 family metalloprotease domain-containing protein [Symbiobacteriaceae bacterium]
MLMRRWKSVLMVFVMIAAFTLPGPVTASPPERLAADPYALAPDEIFDYIPPTNEVLQLVQPDGSAVEARLTPMETGGQMETLDGYTVVKGDDGWWSYAQEVPAGQLVSSGLVPGRDVPQGIAKKLGQTKSKFEGAEGEDLRQPMFDAIHELSSPNASIFATEDDENLPTVYRYVVLMVEFQDVKFAPHQTKEYFESQLTGLGMSPTGTLSDYYYENSYGKFLPMMDVYGPFTSDYNLATYDYQISGGHNVGWMINYDIGPKAKDVIAWDQYDNDRVVYTSQGVRYRSVDMLVVIQAGPGKEATGQAGHIWSHATSASFTTGEIGPDDLPIRIRAVNITPGIGFNIGVVGHEMGHSIGESDYYATSYNSMGSGDWDMMAGGSWMGNNPAGSNPAHHNPFVKIHQGWITPQVVTETTTGIELRPRSVAPDLIQIPLGGTGTGSGGVGAEESLFVEYISTRAPEAIFDKALPGSGLLIWHYDRGGNQNNPARYRMAVVEYDFRDGTQELRLNFNRGEPTDPWVNTEVGLTPLTTPNTNRNTPLVAGGPLETGWNLVNISGLGETMSLDIVQAAAIGKLTVDRPAFAEEPVIAGAGPAPVSALVTNQTGELLEDIPVEFRIQVGAKEQTIATATIPVLEPGASVPVVGMWEEPFAGKYNVTAAPIASVPVAFEPGLLRVFVRDAPVLIVDDDDNYNAEEAFEGVLNSLNVPFVLVNKTASLATLSRYDLVIWSAGQAGRNQGALTRDEVEDLKAYLNGGGKLWMSSPRLAAALGGRSTPPGTDPDMLRDYFGVYYPMSSQLAGGTITGLGHPIGGTDTFALRPFPGRDVEDFLDPVESTIGTATPLFTWSLGHHLGTAVVGDEAHNGFRVVFFGFSLAQVISGADRLTLTQQVLDHMGVVSVGLDKATYLVQSAGAVKITLRDPSAEAPVVKVTSDADPAGIDVTLNPAGPGAFTGVINVQKTDSKGNSLKVNATDTIRVAYGSAWASASVLEKQVQDLPPVIDHDDIFTAMDAENLPVLAVVTDDVRLHQVNLFYRVAGSGAYTRAKMMETAANAFTAVIPAKAVTPLGVEYYMEATDVSATGNVTSHFTAEEPMFITIQPRTLGLE